MKKVALLLVAAAALLWIASPAQAFLGTGLLPFGGMFGSGGGCNPCEEPFKMIVPPILYVGWNDDPRGVVWNENSSGAVTGFYQVSQGHRVRGWWLGVTQQVNLSENLSILASGWYLFPLGTEAPEFYSEPGGATTFQRVWSVKDEWWFVDGLAAFSPGYAGGFALLAGLRYDYFYSKYDSPYNNFGFPSSPLDEATIRSQAWIPLIGAQYAYNGPLSSLSMRFVGFPTLGGNFRGNENVGAGVSPGEGRGNYQGGYFLEFFGEASRNISGANIGVFVRWNDFHAHAPSLSTTTLGIGSQTVDFDLDRHSWTAGGMVSVNF